jgi:AcrR family transcriptional regulator
MRGRKPVRPLAEIADAAVRVFTDKGFRQAGISDVAAALGLSHGAVYTYVDSKQALLYLALLRAMRPDAVTMLKIPVTARPPQELVDVAEEWVGKQIAAAAVAPAPDHPARRPAAQELADLIDVQYGFVERHRQVLELVGRCAEDVPELAQWFYVRVRRSNLEMLGEFLRNRIESGELAPVPDVPAAARFIVETIAWFAMHRYGDPDSGMLDDDSCRRTVHHLLLAAFLPKQ